MAFVNVPRSHPFGLQAAHDALAKADHAGNACLVIVLMDNCPACEHMKGAIREVESQMMSGQGPPGSVVVVESQIAQQSDHPALSASAFPSANVITSGSDSVTPVVGRSSAELLDALAIAASQGTLGQHSSAGSELEPIDVGVGPSIALSGIPTSVTAKKKKKKTKKKKKKTKKKKGGGTRRRRRGGRTRRRGGRASRSRLRGGGPQLGCGCA